MKINELLAGGIRNGIAVIHNGTTVVDRRLDVYKGTMPSDLSTFDPATRSSDLLVRFTSVTVQVDNTTLKGLTYSNSSPPVATNATATGTASWFALYYAPDPDAAIFGEVSDVAGSGALKLSSTSITSGNSIDPGSLIIKIQRTPFV